MAWDTVKLKPGINVEQTPTALEAGYSASSNIRFKAGLPQKVGGWARYCPNNLLGTPKHSHSWEDLNGNARFAVGTSTNLYDVTPFSMGALFASDGSPLLAGDDSPLFGTTSIGVGSVVRDISPQTLTTNPAVSFTTTAGSPVVTVTDTEVDSITAYDSVFFNTPTSVGGIVLSGLYAVTAYLSATEYTITAATNAASSVSTGGTIPNFTATSGSPVVTVTLPAHGLSVGGDIVFPVATTVGGITISGRAIVQTVTDADNFTISGTNTASATAGPTAMNAGLAQFVYSLTTGPVATGGAYGVGTYGTGLYGSGSVVSAQTGTALPAADWTLDNWGELLIGCPEGGGLYYWGPASGYSNAAAIATAPAFNTGAFVSIAEQQIVAYGSTVESSIGVYHDPLYVRWCDVGNFFQWKNLVANQAGAYRIPTGSRIVGGFAGPATTNYIWTDVNLWAMNYIGSQFVYGFTRVADNCGLIAKHAHAELSGTVYWMGQNGFFQMAGGVVSQIPCTVWDAVFQNIDRSNVKLCHAGANTAFSEVLFFFPSSAGRGYCDTVAKFNTIEQTWDVTADPAFAQRNTWIDVSVIPNPIATTNSGAIYAHENGMDADNAPINWFFESGYFSIGNGREIPLIKRIFPDFKYGEYAGSQNASIQITVKLKKYPSGGSNPDKTYGPYTVSAATPMIRKNMRGGHYVSFRVEGSDSGSFARLGAIKVLWQPDGQGA